MAKNQCEGCIYWKYIGGDRACHYLLDTGKRRVRDGDGCLSYERRVPRKAKKAAGGRDCWGKKTAPEGAAN